jgi:general stress protein YciG
MASTNEKSESRGRGFAGMDPERQRQISSQGGKAAHQKGTAHEFDSEEAREAGRKGGMVSGGRRRAREQGQRATAEATPTPQAEADTDAENENEESEAESRTMGSQEGVGPQHA